MPRRATRTSAGKRAEAIAANTQKAGRLAAGAMSDGAKFICPSCGLHSENIVKDFYASSSPIYDYSRSLPICKKCANQLLDDFTLKYKDPMIAMQRICEVMDIYYNDEVAEKAKGTNWLSNYISRVSRSPYIGKTYRDTIKEGNDILAQEQVIDQDTGISKKLIKRWGIGYSKDQYNWMQDEYDDWCQRYEVIGDKSLEILVTNIVRTELEIQEATNTGADVNKLTTRLNTLLGSANLKPSQNAEGEDLIYPFGVEIEKVEEGMPIEPDPQFEDVDGIKRYMQIFSGHIAKMFNRPNRFTQIYEEEMEKYTVHPPHYDEEDEVSAEELFNDGD